MSSEVPEGIAEQSRDRGWCWLREGPSGRRYWRCSQHSADFAESSSQSTLLIVAWSGEGDEPGRGRSPEEEEGDG